MACIINSGVALDCLDGVGGVDTFYVTELENLNIFTSDTSGNVTAMTLDTGKQFFTFNIEKEKGVFTEETTGSVENGTVFWAQTFTTPLNKLSANARHLLKLISYNRVMVIVKDNNGNYLLMGKTGARMTGNTATTGTAFGDLNGNTLTFTSNEPQPAYYVSSSLIATLTAPAA